MQHTMTRFGILALSVSLCGCDGPGEGRAGSPESQELDRAETALVTDPGQLRWSDMQPLEGAPVGEPLFVSNNPEHVGGFGILAGVPYPGLSLRRAQRAPEAPAAHWTGEPIDPACPGGGVRSFGVYLAHILNADLGAGRRVTLVVVPEDDATVHVHGDMGTTDWSVGGVPRTIRTDWLGADLAKSFFFRPHLLPERTFEGKAGEMLTIDSQLATSLVEGRYHIESDSCLHPFTIAHAANLGGVLPGHYAPGDVKWPGWFEGQGYGRAAGVYESDRWEGEQAVVIGDVPSVQGVGLLTASDSMEALARHEDSADLLFGNYGVLHDQTLHLDNETGECVEARVELVSYIDRNGQPDRTPTEAFFRETAGAYTPSMLWNGPVEVLSSAGALLFHPVLRYAPTAAEQADPHRAMASMRKALATVRVEAGDTEAVQVRLPVPGYIVAPVALTVESRPCG